MTAVYSGSATFKAPISDIVLVKINAAPVVFSSTVVGSTSEERVVTSTNSGASELAVSAIKIAGENASAFVYVNTCPSALASGQACLIYVAFAPIKPGSASAKLTITDNASGSPQTVSLSGIASAIPSVKLTSNPLTFTKTPVGSESLGQSVTLTNSGTTALMIAGINVSGTNAIDFLALNNCASTLASKASCAIEGTFKPVSDGSKTATVTIANDAAGLPQKITLAGTGIAVSGTPIETIHKP